MEQGTGDLQQPKRRIPRQKRLRIRMVTGLLCVFVVVLGMYRLLKHDAVATRQRENLEAIVPGPPDPPGIVLHSSDSPAVVGGVSINAARLEKIHADDHPTWATVYQGKTYHIGYHYVILPNGTIEQGRPDRCPGAHARKHNDWIGICLIGAFSTKANPNWWPSRPTSHQLASLLTLCHRLMSEYHIPPEQVKRHRDVNQTWCPGGRFPYQEVVADLQTYAKLHPEVRQKRNFLASNRAGG